MAAVEKSSPTIMLRLFTRSASTPPTIERMTIGAKEQAVTTPNSVDEPVSLNRYSGKANRKMALPEKGNDLADHDESKITPEKFCLHKIPPLSRY